MKLTDGLFSGFRMNVLPFSWKFADITTIIIIETELRPITVAKIPTPGTTITQETGTGITSPTTVSSPTTGEGIWNPKIRAFSKKSVQSPRKSSENEVDVLMTSLPSRTYSRYDDRYYGREDPYYANTVSREPAYYDQRYNANSYRGNGKDHTNNGLRVLIWSITLCWFI